MNLAIFTIILPYLPIYGHGWPDLPIFYCVCPYFTTLYIAHDWCHRCDILDMGVKLGMPVQAYQAFYLKSWIQVELDDKAWRPWGIPTQECVKYSLK